ncbi:TRUD domain-containing protein [Balamuthia mandrillaris]
MQAAAAPVCNFPGCTKAVFVEPTTNRVHDYCGRTHATAHGALKAQPQAKATTGVAPSSSPAAKVCGLPGCHKAAYVEPGTGKVHDYCGRTHAQTHLGILFFILSLHSELSLLLPSRPSFPVISTVFFETLSLPNHILAASSTSSPTATLPSSSSSVTPTTQGTTPSSTTS